MSNKTDGKEGWNNPLYVDSPASRKIIDSLQLGKLLHRKVASDLALGTFLIELPTTSTLTAIALAGFDFVVIDMEHSAIDFSDLQVLITAGHAAGLITLVRTCGQDTGLIGKALDVGAHGIMAPRVETPERAKSIVEEARFPPLGNRGFSPLTKYDALKKPLTSLNESTYVVVQIEGHAALERAGEIASVEGVDAIFVGPYDLALSLGVPPGCEDVYAAAEEIAEAVPKGVGLGIYMDNPGKSGTWLARGFSLQCVSFDGRMMANGARSIVDAARQSAGSQVEKKRK